MYYSDFGYKDYQEYLDGPEWEEIRVFFYENCGEYKCRVCGKRRRLVLHKRSYEYLGIKALRRHYFFTFLIIRKLRRLMVWLCFSCNREIHFYENGIRVPLIYDYLWRREQQVYKQHRSLWKKLLQLRPSDILGAIVRVYQV